MKNSKLIALIICFLTVGGLQSCKTTQDATTVPEKKVAEKEVPKAKEQVVPGAVSAPLPVE